jgi:hypothetical protein
VGGGYGGAYAPSSHGRASPACLSSAASGLTGLPSEPSGSLDIGGGGGLLPASTSSSDSVLAFAAHPPSPPPEAGAGADAEDGGGGADAGPPARAGGALSRLFGAVRTTSVTAARAGGAVLRGLQSGLEAIVAQPEGGAAGGLGGGDGFDLLPRTSGQAASMEQAAKNRAQAEAFYNLHPIHGLY